MDGIFVTLEGPDGAGKSTQARMLADRLLDAGHTVVLTREPGGTSLGERVREILLAETSQHDALVDALLFSAARRQLVRQVIEPALDAGSVVICDRFADSTLAYQGYGAKAPLDSLWRLADVATSGLQPDRTVLLELPVETGLKRRFQGEAADLTRFETSTDFDVAFHERVRAGFLELAALESERWRVVDAQGSEAKVADAVWAAVSDLFGE
ncbi:MAG: dTMP kinase [Candidatus Limnocylindrales bacterium]